MALSILDGNQSATTLSTILSSGQHITAHTVVSLGTQAITDMRGAVSGSVVSISNFPATQPVSIASVTIGNTVTISGTVTANPTGTQTIAGTVTATNPNLSSNADAANAPVLRTGVYAYDYNNDWQVGVAVLGSGSNAALNVGGTVTAQAFGYQFRELPIEQDGGIAGYGNYIPIGYRDGGNARIVDSNQPLPISGTVTIGSALPAGTNRIGVVTIGGGTVTLGTSTAQIGSVTASITGTVPVSGTFWQATQPASLASLPALAAGTAQIGSVTASISANPSGALTTRFGSVTTANTAQITTAVTNTSRKYLFAQNISVGSVTVGIGFSPTTTQGIQLSAGSGIVFDSFCPTGAVYWLGATTGAAWSILEG